MDHLLGEGFTGYVHSPLPELFFISDLILQDTREMFCLCYQEWMVVSVIPKVEGGFRGTPKGGCTPP